MSMIMIVGKVLPAKENREGRKSGHLHLLKRETRRVGDPPREGSTVLQREGGAPTTTVKSESVMQKRQQDRSYKDSDATGAGIARPGVIPEVAEAPTIKREFMLTPFADDTLHDVIRVLSRATGTTLSNSHFLRVMLKVVANAMPDIEREAKRLGELDRPGNARENQAEREKFELKFASAVAAALKAAPPPEWDDGGSRKGKDTGKRPA